MRRIVLTLAAAAAFTFATALPVASVGLTDVTVNCDDGTSFSATVDLDTLTGLTNSIEAMTLFPADLSCSLIQMPAYRALGGVASAWPGGGFIVGGGRFQAGCPGGLLGGGLYWVNFAVSAHTEGDLAGDTRGGTFNLTVPAGQCVGPSHITTKPTCLAINAEFGTPPLGAYYAWLRSTITQASGGWSGTEGQELGSAWKDTGNPGQQLPNNPDREADSPQSSCPSTVYPGTPNPDGAESHPIPNGNVTIHPTQ